MRVAVRNLQRKIPLNSKKIVKAVQKILSQEDVEKSGEITLSFVGDKKIKELNLKYLGVDTPTDVIAFDLAGGGCADRYLADIVISTQRAIDNARVFHTRPLYEVYLYVIHGVLHILGYDDKTPRQRKIMQERARRILKAVIRNS